MGAASFSSSAALNLGGADGVGAAVGWEAGSAAKAAKDQLIIKSKYCVFMVWVRLDLQRNMAGLRQQRNSVGLDRAHRRWRVVLNVEARQEEVNRGDGFAPHR